MPLTDPHPPSHGAREPAYYPGLPLPRRFWAIITVLIGLAMVVLDSSLVSIALPTISRDLRIDPADAIWVVNAFQLAVAVSLLPLSSLADRVGYRHIYMAGMAVYALGALICALAPSLTVLITARVLEGLGAAGIYSVNGALVRYIYPTEQLGRGIGYSAVVVGLFSAAGPPIGSLLLSIAPWPVLFAICIPFAIGVLVLGRRSLPDNPRRRDPFDTVSALLSAITVALLIHGFTALGAAGQRGTALGELGLTAILFIWLLRRQGGQPAPLVPIDLFRGRAFALAVGTSFCSFFAQMSLIVSIPFLLEYEFGRSHDVTGMLITPMALTAGLTALIAGRMADRYPVGILAGMGLSAFAIALALLTAMPTSAGNLRIGLTMLLCGLGFGFFQTPNNRALLGSVPQERIGAASGVQATTRLIAHSIGTASVALLFHLAFDEGPRRALLVAAIVATLGAIISFVRLVPPDRKAA